MGTNVFSFSVFLERLKAWGEGSDLTVGFEEERLSGFGARPASSGALLFADRGCFVGQKPGVEKAGSLGVSDAGLNLGLSVVGRGEGVYVCAEEMAPLALRRRTSARLFLGRESIGDSRQGASRGVTWLTRIYLVYYHHHHAQRNIPQHEHPRHHHRPRRLGPLRQP